MALTVFNEIVDLPVFGIEPGEQAFVKETSSLYSYEDLSLLSSYSYAFNGNSAISAIDSTMESFDSSGSPFTVDFWSYTFGGSVPYFSAFVKNASVNLFDGSPDSNEIAFNAAVDVLPSSPYDGEYELATFYNGDSAISEVSLSSDMDLLSPYTVQYWAKNLSAAAFNVSSLTDGSDVLRIRGDRITSLDVPFTIPNNGYKNDIWEHHSVVYDGYDHSYYNNGKKETLIRSPEYIIAPGNLSYTNFEKNNDISFQAKVLFSSNPSTGTLFLAGGGSNRTEISISGAGDLTFLCKDLSISISDFPKDDQEHVISWDIQIKPKRIRLWIDGDIKGEESGSTGLSENRWASPATSTSFSEYPSGDFARSDLDIATGYRNSALADPVEIYGKNITINSSKNPRYTVFTFNDRGKFPLINPAGNNVYYFETNWAGTGSALIRPFLVDGNSTVGDNGVYQEPWYGIIVNRFSRGTEAGGGSSNLFQSGWSFSGQPMSFIISEPLGKIYSIRNGYKLVGVDDFSPGAMIAGPAGGFELGFDVRPRNPWSRAYNNPQEIMEVSFSSENWAFDPEAVYRSAVPTDPEGGYAASGNFTSWNGVTNAANGLYHYPSTFKKITDSKVYIGSNFRDISTDETGNSYAQEYVSASGGSIVSVTGGGDINSALDSISSGDALELGAGIYEATSTMETIFRNKNFLICGSSSNSSDTVLNYTPGDFADHPIFNSRSNSSAQIAFLTFNRISLKTRNYNTALHKFSKGGVSYRVNYGFNNKPVSWLYDNVFYPSVKVFEQCTFSNYSVWSGTYSGDNLSVTSKNNAFEGLFSDQCSLSGYNDDTVSFNFSNQTYTNNRYRGYVKDYSINSGIIYDSDFSTSTVQNDIDSNTILFSKESRAGDIFLSLNTDGDVTINNTKYENTAYPSDVWTHHAISYDGNKLRAYKDGSLISENVTDFDGYSLSDVSFDIGKTNVLNSPQGNFKNSYYTGSLKEFRLADSAIYVDSSYTIPVADRIADSGDIFITANDAQVPDTNLVTILNDVQATLFSPYSSDARGWIRSGVFAKNWNSAFNVDEDDVDFDFDSNAHLDSFGPNIILQFSEKDDEDVDLTWDYKANQIEEIFSVSRDSTDSKFLLERRLLDGKGISASSVFSFTSKRNGSDSTGRFFFIEKSAELTDGVTLEILADQYSVINSPIGTPFGLRNVSFEFVDSTTDVSGFTLDSSELYSIFADDINVRIYDSTGEFL